MLFSTVCSSALHSPLVSFFFFNDTATTEIYTLSLHDALPISRAAPSTPCRARARQARRGRPTLRRPLPWGPTPVAARSRPSPSRDTTGLYDAHSSQSPRREGDGRDPGEGRRSSLEASSSTVTL